MGKKLVFILVLGLIVLGDAQKHTVPDNSTNTVQINFKEVKDQLDAMSKSITTTNLIINKNATPEVLVVTHTLEITINGEKYKMLLHKE